MAIFTAPDTWHGGHVEMWVSFVSNPALHVALDAFWSLPAVDGPYASRDLDPTFQRRLPRERWTEPLYDEFSDPLDDSYSQVYAIIRLADGSRVPAAVTVRDDWTDEIAELSIRLPLGGLSHVRDMETLFDEDGEDLPVWLGSLAEEMHQIARYLWEAAPFEDGLIGLDAGMYAVEEVRYDPYWQEVVGALFTEHGRLVWQPPTGEAPRE